jgi:hypothetical protein
MTGVWSGGVVYEWTQENNRYGLVSINTQGEAEVLPDYTNLQNAIAKTNPKGVKMDAYADVKNAADCPPVAGNWKASSTLPPTPSDGACDCMIQNMECVASDKVSMVAGQTGNNTLGSQLDTMCGLVSCSEIGGDAEKGVYGAFSFCSARDKLSWLYNLKAKESKQCNYNGLGQEVQPKRFDINTCARIAPNLDGITEENGSSSPSQSSNSASNNLDHGNAFVASVVCVLAATFFM